AAVLGWRPGGPGIAGAAVPWRQTGVGERLSSRQATDRLNRTAAPASIAESKGVFSIFNMLKTAVLMAAITALFMAIGALIGGRSGMMFALVIALGMNFFSYWFSDKLVLRMYNAQEVDATSAPQFYRMVADLAQRAGLPMPRVYLINEDAPNAFATGRNPEHAAVAAT